MKAERGIRILAQLFEVKTGLQERALSSPAKTRNFCMTEIKGIDKAIEIVRKEFQHEEKTDAKVDYCPYCGRIMNIP